MLIQAPWCGHHHRHMHNHINWADVKQRWTAVWALLGLIGMAWPILIIIMELNNGTCIALISKIHGGSQ